MGITGLLPFVKVASSDKHLSHFQGQTAAIDSYCWLHKGAFGCAEKIAKGEPTTAYVQYCFKFITMLQTFHIKPIMVFDGRHLPAKKQTEVKRRESRQQAKKRAIEALSLGKVKDARSNFQRCIDITPEMAFELIKECRKRQIDCIVAPYEADPQLAFLNREKIADFIISEDSDLLTFGCERVLFKLNLAGNGTLVEANKLHMAMGERADEYSLTRFRHMCILSGCDYIDSLPGIGLKKALKFLTSYPKTPIHDAILRLPALLKMRKLTITKEYIDNFLVAEATFKHQIIFNPLTKVLEPLFDTGLMNTNPRYCCNAGLNFGNALGYQMAIGNLNPLTMDKIDSWFPTNSNICPTSIWKKLATTTSPNTATITSYFQAQPSTSFHRPLILSKTPKKRKNITINPVPLSERQNDSGISDEILLKMYSAVAKSPPTKRTRIDSEDDEELSSPVISRRKDIINPFLRNMNTKRKILFTEDATTLLRSDSEQIDTEIPGTSNAQITSANKDESIASSSSMENEFDTSNDTIIESSDESIDNNRDATTKPKVTNVDSAEKKKRSVRKPRVQTPKETEPLQTDKQLAILPSIFTKSSSSQACRNTTTYDSPIVSVGQYPRSKYVLTEHNAVASAAQTNQETTPVKLQKYRKCPKITTNNCESSTKASTSGNTQYTPKFSVTNSLNTPTVTNTTQTPSKLSTPSRLTLCSVGNPKIPYIKEGSIIHVPAKTLIIKKMTPEKVTCSYASSNKPPCVRKLLDTSSNIFEPTKSANNSLRQTQAITKPITVTKAQVHSSTTTPTLALLKSSRLLQTIPKPKTTQVSVLKPQESATSHYFSTVKTVCATKKALLNQPSAKFAQDAKLAVFDAASSRDLTGGENVLPQSNILILKCSASDTTSATSKGVNVTGEGTSRLACLNQFSKTSKTTLNVCKKSLLIKIPKNKSIDANASTSEGAPNLVTLVCDKTIEILKVIETPKDVMKTVNIDDTNQTQSQRENVTSDEDTIIEPILTNSNNGNKIEPLQESVVHQNPSNLIHRRHPQGGTQPGSIWDIGSQILDICKSNLAKMRKKSTETAEEPSENPTEESSEKPTENPSDETSEKPTEEFNESHEIIENVGAHETEGTFQNDVSGNVQMDHTTKQNEQITDTIEISDDSSHNTTNSRPQIIPKFESTKYRAHTGNNKPKDKKSKKNGKQNIKLNPNQPTLSHFGFKKM